MIFLNKRSSVLVTSVLLLSVSGMTQGATYWISKSGSDGNSCKEESNACATIQKGIRLAMPGDKVNIKEGVYIEDSSKSEYTSKCAWLDNDPVGSLCSARNGTKDKPIVIQAAPGHEGRVIVDSQSKRLGIHLNNVDYLHIRGLTLRNNVITGIASWGQPENAVADERRLSIGVVLEHNSIFNTRGPYGRNTAAIHMWGTKDWIVRSNRIDNVAEEGRSGNGIQAYGVINALVEHNHITNASTGVYWKDHYVLSKINRGFVVESEIRYNLLDVSKVGVQITIKGAKSPEAGINNIHHNIITGLKSGGYGIRTGLAGAYGLSGPITIKNNLIDGGDKSNTAISIDSAKGIHLAGNIFLRVKNDIEFVTYSKKKKPLLLSSNYNVFDGQFKAILDRYGNVPDVPVKSLSAWRSMRATDAISLGMDYPDTKSKVYKSSDIVKNAEAKNYKYTDKFSADKFMPNNTNAGPYQKGNEVIGLLEDYSVFESISKQASKPVAPTASLSFR